jgi:hypothetical protein
MRFAVTTSPSTLPSTFNPTPPPTVAGGTARELSCMWAPLVACAWLWTIMGAVAILPVVPLPTGTLLCACARVHACVCLQRGCTGTRVALPGPAVFIARPRRTRVRFALAIGRPPICAAGVTWTSRTLSAPWAARSGHTTVIDAAGAIYVIGGYGTTHFKDVWVSTDGGADQTREGGTRLVLAGTLRATQGVLRGYSMVL